MILEPENYNKNLKYLYTIRFISTLIIINWLIIGNILYNFFNRKDA
jgi:hypothetical protein